VRPRMTYRQGFFSLGMYLGSLLLSSSLYALLGAVRVCGLTGSISSPIGAIVYLYTIRESRYSIALVPAYTCSVGGLSYKVIGRFRS
jgi:hypothetical protein